MHLKYPKYLLGMALSASLLALSGCVIPPATAAGPGIVLAAPPTAMACNSCGVISAIQALSPGGYRVTLRMDNGGMRTLDLARQPAFQVGDRVQILRRTPY